jgi:transcriptional regulator with XRE-family HTH domain
MQGVEPLGARMKKAALRAGLSAYKIARELEVYPPTVYDWWRSKYRPSPTNLRAYADLVGMRMDELSDGMVIADRASWDAEVKDTASQIVLEVLGRIAQGETPEAAFAAATGGVEQLTDAERKAIEDGAGKLLTYLNEDSGGDWKSLPPEKRLEIVDHLIQG